MKAKRRVTVAAGGIAGFIIAAVVQANFESFFENFFLALSYWIVPYLAILLIDFYVVKRRSVETSANPAKWDWPVLAIYGLSFLVSVPFMVPQLRAHVGQLGMRRRTGWTRGRSVGSRGGSAVDQKANDTPAAARFYPHFATSPPC